MRIRTSSIAAIAAAASALLAAPAFAQTWTYATFSEVANANAGTFGNSWSTTQSGVKLTVSAYSTTGASGAIQTANIANYGVGSGFGVRNQIEGLAVSSPQHAMDNYTHTDFLALNFTNAVTAAAVNANITQLATGWHNTSTTTGLTCNGSQANCVDSDISLLRWTGAGGPTITGGTIASLLAAGWQLVNHYDNMVDDVSRNTLSGSSSSWWLISSYNSAWGTGTTTASTNLTNLSNGDDFVKVLSSVTTTGISLPVPGSLPLAGAALLAAMVARRKFARK